MKKEHVSNNTLPELARFSETSVAPGEAFDHALTQTNKNMMLFTSRENAAVAEMYRAVVGKSTNDCAIVVTENPIRAAIQVKNRQIIPLVLHSATDAELLERMFADGPKLGQPLMSQLYTPTVGHESASLFAIGIANQGLELLHKTSPQMDEETAEGINARRKAILKDTIAHHEFRDILRSHGVQKIIAHALGPVGTNISQAMAQYLETVGVQDKAELVVHEAGIEPQHYAETAAAQVTPGVVPIHMECAVFYGMDEMFHSRTNEVVFADHHFMPLDAMQLASVKPIEDLSAGGKMKIATHPSPRPLIAGWENAKRAEWMKAPSNAAAAQMVLAGEADACITTGSGLKEAEGLKSKFVFGSPVMLFTIATPLSQRLLQEYRRKIQP